MLILITLGLVAVGAMFYYINNSLKYWKNRGVNQGSDFSYFSDNWGVVTRSQSFPELVQYMYNKCPGTRYCGSYHFFTPTFLLRDPDLIKQITVKDFEHFKDHRTIVNAESDPLWGKNLFALTGQRWRDMRTILSPSFTSSKMKSMFFLMTECAENFIQHFLKRDDDIIVLEMKDTFTRFTNDVIATTAFGVKVDSLEDPKNEFYSMGTEITNFRGFWKMMKFFAYIIVPKLCKIFNVTFFDKKVSLFFNDLIFETVKAREDKGIIRPDMIHLLMEAKKGNQKHEENGIIDTGFATVQESDIGKDKHGHIEITAEDIAAQALIFFFAGFDSVSGLMCFSTHELAVNPDIQEKLRQEIRDTLEQYGGKLTYEALLKMKYMDMFISETLRKWPTIVAVDRVCTKPYTLEPATPHERTIHLDKGAILWFPIFALHRDPEYYPDPDRFDPERFSDENKKNIKPYTYLPFGMGPRNCIGSRFALLETKAVLFHLLSHFEIVPVAKTGIPLIIDRRSFSMVAEGGFWLGLKRLDSK